MPTLPRDTHNTDETDRPARDPSNARHRSGGGAATTSGTRFQENVGAYLAVRVLAEESASPGFGLASSVTLTAIYAESSLHDIDDLTVQTSQDGQLFLSCKTSVSLSQSSSSTLAGVIQQCVRQMHSGVATGDGSRGVDPSRDRMILAVEADASRSITRDLRDAVQRLCVSQSSDVLCATTSQLNERQTRAVAVLRGHFEHEWNTLHSGPPDSAQWLLFLQLFRVWPASFEADAPEYREAQHLLRAHILEAPSFVDQAWATLIAMVRDFGPERRGADRHQLRHELATSGSALLGTQSYTGDIAQLQQITAQRLLSISRYAVIEVGGQQLKIERSTVGAIIETARSGDLLLIGEPGAGKSGCLHDVAQHLRSGPLVVLEAEQLSTTTASELAAGLGLSRNRSVADVLKNWPRQAGDPTVPGYILIDALDAARGPTSMAALCDVLRQIRRDAGWRIIATVREFDLRHNRELQEHFEGTAHDTLRSSTLGNCRHLSVPRLTDAELLGAQEQLPALGDVLRDATDDLRTLVTNPFNLRLLVLLLGVGTRLDELTAIRAQVELLDRYWDARVSVHTDDQAVTPLVQAMLDARQLLLPLVEATAHCDAQPLAQLQGSGLLHIASTSPLPGAGRVVGFTHNILFDYAVARLCFQDIPDHVIDRLQSEGDADLVFFARPSLVLALQRLWHLPLSNNRELFWARAVALSQSNIRRVGKTVPAVVAEAESSGPQDLTHLLDALSDEDSSVSPDQSPPGVLFRYVISAVLTQLMDGNSKIGPYTHRSGFWLSVASEVLQRGLRGYTWQAQLLLRPLQLHGADGLSDDQVACANEVACALIDLEIRETELTALAVACKTVAHHPERTTAALRRVLQPTRGGEWYEVLSPMAGDLRTLARISQRLAIRVVRSAYQQDYGRDDRYPAGTRLFSMSFGKQDSIDIVRRTIGEQLTVLVNDDPAVGATLILFLMKLVASKETTGHDRPETLAFRFRSDTARIFRDYSAYWSGHAEHEGWEPALRAWRSRLLADNGAHAAGLLDLLAQARSPAIIWHVTLEAGAEAPQTLGLQLYEAMLTPGLHTLSDTKVQAGRCLGATWPYMTVAHRSDLEEMILSLPDLEDEQEEPWRSHERNRLLGCIPDGLVATEEARQILTELRASGGTPPNEPDDSWEIGSLQRPRGPEAAAPTSRVQSLASALESEWPADVAALGSVGVEHLLDLLEQLHSELANGSNGQSTSYVEETYLSKLGTLAATPQLAGWPTAFRRTRDLLISASDDPRPEPPSEPPSTSSGIGWSSGQPRIEAAQGLMSLARHCSSCDAALSGAIQRLAGDPHYVVRHQVLIRLNFLWDSDRELMWQIIETTSQTETDVRLLRNLCICLCRTLFPVASDRVDATVSEIQNRVDDTEGSQSLCRQLVWLRMARAVREGHRPSNRDLEAWCAEPVDNAPYVLAMLSYVRSPLTMKPPEASEEQCAQARAWTFALLERLIPRLVTAYHDLLRQHDGIPYDRWPRAIRSRMELIHRMTSSAADQLYFASGASNARTDQNPTDTAATPATVSRFYREAQGVLQVLADVPFVQPAYHIVKTLGFLEPVDPRGVFLLLRQSVHTATQDSLQYESMAADVVVTIVERYLAVHRDLILVDLELQKALLDVLDIFVGAGWPKAMQLTFRLDEVFR